MKRSTLGLLMGLAVFVVIASQSIFFVGQAQYGLVLQFGEPILPVRQPGLNFKIPFIQSAHLLDKRILYFDIAKVVSHSSDMKQLEVDSYACWQITNPVAFVKTLYNENVATDRLRNIVLAKLNAAIGHKTLIQVVSEERSGIRNTVLEGVNQDVRQYGVEVTDVRIKRTELPALNRKAIFNRMRADRLRMANQYRGEGKAMELKIRSEAEKTRDIIIAKAQMGSTIMRGEADALAMKISAAALSTSPEFYDFVKSLEVYQKSFSDGSRIVLSLDDPLFRYFQP